MGLVTLWGSLVSPRDMHGSMALSHLPHSPLAHTHSRGPLGGPVGVQEQKGHWWLEDAAKTDLMVMGLAKWPSQVGMGPLPTSLVGWSPSLALTPALQALGRGDSGAQTSNFNVSMQNGQIPCGVPDGGIMRAHGQLPTERHTGAGGGGAALAPVPQGGRWGPRAGAGPEGDRPECGEVEPYEQWAQS